MAEQRLGPSERLEFRQKQAALALTYLSNDLQGIGRTLAETIIKLFPTTEPTRSKGRTAAAVAKGKESVDSRRYRAARTECQKGIGRAMQALQAAYDTLIKET
jgi:hypothetical protein